MKYYLNEVRDLKLRIFELERENEKLRQESAEYLGNWIAAQDLASWRQVLMLVKSPETPPEVPPETKT